MQRCGERIGNLSAQAKMEILIFTMQTASLGHPKTSSRVQ
jgi:hypothetical protein